MSASAIRRFSRRSGFSMVEMAIVLGVSTVILAGIWGIVSSVQENVRIDQASQQVRIVATNVRSLLQGQASVPDLTEAQLTSYLIERGAIPPDMKRPGGAPYRADHAWGAAGGTDGGFRVSRGAGGMSFSINFYGLKASSCINLVPKVASGMSGSGLTGVVINGSATAVPVPVSSAASLCAGGSNTAGFQFRLRQPGA